MILGDKNSRVGIEEAKIFASEILNENFFREFWERKVLKVASDKIKNNPFKLHKFLSVDDLQLIFLFADKNLKLYKEGQVYLGENVFNSYLEGASIIVNQAERISASLFNFCRELSNLFFYHTFAVIYLTPPNTFAVRAHTDDQDVFLIQLFGKKSWKFYEPPVELPYTEEMIGKDFPIESSMLQNVITEFDLSAGEILYIPRGYIHEAKTSLTECSLHVTITIPTSDYTWETCAERLLHKSVLNHDPPRNVERFLRSSILKKGALDPIVFSNESKNVENISHYFLSLFSENRLRECFEKHIESANSVQKSVYENKMKDVENYELALSFNDTISMRDEIKCDCSLGTDEAKFFRGDQYLIMKIKSSASALIQKLADREAIKVKDLPCFDPFECIFVCRALLVKSILCIHKNERK